MNMHKHLELAYEAFTKWRHKKINLSGLINQTVIPNAQLSRR